MTLTGNSDQNNVPFASILYGKGIDFDFAFIEELIVECKFCSQLLNGENKNWEKKKHK